MKGFVTRFALCVSNLMCVYVGFFLLLIACLCVSMSPLAMLKVLGIYRGLVRDYFGLKDLKVAMVMR